MADRRQFLGTLAKALGGGLLLPMSGTGALALPDLSGAERLPVRAVPLPLSSEALELRQIRRQLFGLHLQPGNTRDWRTVMDHYGAGVCALASRPSTTWAQVVELAEAAWHMAPKEEVFVDARRWCTAYTGRLATKAGYAGERGECWRMRMNAALIEGVLSLGNGERFDHRIERDRQENALVEDGRHE